MKVYLLESPGRIARAVLEQIKETLSEIENPVLGLATGSTPLRLYGEMIRDYNNGGFSYKKVRTINLDEYVGLDGSHPQSYRYFMNENLFDHIDIKKENTFVPNGVAKDLDAECQRYSKLVSDNPPDIQILGIGSNGHIAFNEPGSSFDSTTRVVDLTENTIKDNSRFFDSIDEVPKQAISMGIKDIMKAKSIILIATGTSKAKALRRMLTEHYAEDSPASVLQMHKNVTIYADESAAHLIPEAF
ncbi:MAG TPA: glucosamine-6-phosphate deaminase [Clostridiales bacterium]|nr:glucosamine-6-phosphate deaminase [Clostridiales bacterium]